MMSGNSILAVNYVLIMGERRSFGNLTTLSVLFSGNSILAVLIMGNGSCLETPHYSIFPLQWTNNTNLCGLSIGIVCNIIVII